MKKAEATLYYGDNGVHEFWETPKGSKPSVLMYRNHQEKYWTANVNGLLLEEPLNTQDIRDISSSNSQPQRQQKIWSN